MQWGNCSLDFALVVHHELSGRTGNDQLARLLDLGLEGDLVAVTPHLGDDGLAWDDGACEADLDVLEGAEPKKGRIWLDLGFCTRRLWIGKTYVS